MQEIEAQFHTFGALLEQHVCQAERYVGKFATAQVDEILKKGGINIAEVPIHVLLGAIHADQGHLTIEKVKYFLEHPEEALHVCVRSLAEVVLEDIQADALAEDQLCESYLEEAACKRKQIKK